VFVLIALVILSGCVKPEALSEKNVTKKPAPVKVEPKSNDSVVSIASVNESSSLPDVSDQTGDSTSANITLESNDTVPAVPAEPAKPQNRIDVRTGSKSSDVTSLWDGKTEKFTVPDVDVDAVAFDIAQHLGKGIREVRPFIYINGEAYLKPTELKKELAKYSQNEVKSFNISTIPILATKEEGFIRGVGCDFEKKYLRVDLANPSDKELTIYKEGGSGPKIKDALVISLNRRLLGDMNCGDSNKVSPGLKVSCVRGASIFISGGSMNQAETNASYDTSKPDLVYATRPGYHESIQFFCRPSQGNSTDS